MKKIEENQIKQAREDVEKTYIIDDIDEELIVVPDHANKTYKEGNSHRVNVVTTVVEQQTWEDLEDDYDDE